MVFPSDINTYHSRILPIHTYIYIHTNTYIISKQEERNLYYTYIYTYIIHTFLTILSNYIITGVVYMFDLEYTYNTISSNIIIYDTSE